MSTTANQWDRNAEAYRTYFTDDDRRMSSAVVFPRIIALPGDIRGKSILDFGCGQGRFTRALHDRGALVTGFDSSKRELDIAAAPSDQLPVMAQQREAAVHSPREERHGSVRSRRLLRPHVHEKLQTRQQGVRDGAVDIDR